MPSRREMIAMTPEEISAYLRSQPRMILATIGPDGLPHPMPMNFGLDAMDRVYLTTFRKSQKVKNLERDPRATLLVESGDSYANFKSVLAYADAEILGDALSFRDTMRHLHWSVASEVRSEAIAGQITDTFAKRVIIRFTPFKYVSWDHAKLGGTY